MTDLKRITQTLEKNSATTFMTTLFEVLNTTKKAHLQAKNKSYAEHMALGTFYDSFEDQLDTFIETYFGKFGVKDFAILGADNGPILNYIKSKVSYFEASYDLFKDGFLVNQLDAIIQECYHLIYKLENLK